MFDSKPYTFVFFREFFPRFFFVDFFLWENFLFFCWKNLGRKKSENFRRKKNIFFRTKIKSIYFGVKHIQRRAPNSVWARRTISLKLLIILMDIDRRYPFNSFGKKLMLVSSTKLNHINPLGNSQGEIGNSVFFYFFKMWRKKSPQKKSPPFGRSFSQN